MIHKFVSGVATLAILGLLIAAPAHAQDDVSWLLGQINALRAQVGVAGYVLNGQLSAAATQHSSYMATTCDVAHTEANGSTPADRARANGYGGSWINENIYGGGIARASDAWNFWINSGIHYSALVNTQTNEIGIGVASGNCGHYFTLVFGYRADVSAPPVAPPPAAESGGEEAAAPAVAAVPTQAPYVPPPPSRTPTATIPTLTPSATWTITPTHTPSPTGTVRPPTGTPISLPTVPALGQSMVVTQQPEAVAVQPSATETVPLPPAPVAVAPTHSDFSPRDLLPFALAGQVVLIGIAGFVYFRRTRT